jgi:TonB family protein
MKLLPFDRAAVLRVAALCATVSAASPAHAQRARNPLLLSERPAPREGCKVESRPGTLPSFAELADSATLATTMRDFAREHPVRDGKTFGVYSVAFAADGRVERVAPVDYFLPQGYEPEFGSMIRTALRAQRPGTAWSVRVRIEPGDVPVFRVGRSETCEPVSLTRFELNAPALAQVERPAPMRVRVRVGAEGEAMGIEILRRSGDSELDRWVEQTLMRRAFRPGLVDGVAVPMDSEQTVTIRYRP